MNPTIASPTTETNASSQTIRYSALEKYESPKQRAHWEKALASQQTVKPAGRIPAVIAAAVVVAILCAAASSVSILAIPITVGLAIVVAIIYAVRRHNKLAKAATAFAADNGWTLVQETPSVQLASITPSVQANQIAGVQLAGLRRVDTKFEQPIIKGTLENCPFYLYRYRVTLRYQRPTGNTSAQSEQVQVNSYQVLSIQLPGPLPAFFLDSKADGRQEERNGIVRNQFEKLQLEGDFDHYFDLWQQPGTQIDVLSIFTPEFMQLLIQRGAHLNIESDGHYLHFISLYGDILNCTPTKYLFEQSLVVLRKSLFKLQSYQPTPQSRLEAVPMAQS
jgi:hypothetical protein